MYKNRKGFTLIETIVVIGLIAVIGTVLLVNTRSIFNKNTDKVTTNQYNQVKAAANAYLTTYREELEDMYNEKGYIILTVADLQEKGLIDEDTNLDKNSRVKITLDSNGNPNIEYPTKDTGSQSFELNAPPVYLTYDPANTGNWCNYNNEIEGLKATLSSDASDRALSTSEIKNYIKESDITCNVDITKVGNYEVVYSYKDPVTNKTRKITRNVYVNPYTADVKSISVDMNDTYADYIGKVQNNKISIYNARQNNGQEKINIHIKETKRDGSSEVKNYQFVRVGAGNYQVKDAGGNNTVYTVTDFNTDSKHTGYLNLTNNKVNSDGSTVRSIRVKYDVDYLIGTNPKMKATDNVPSGRSHVQTFGLNTTSDKTTYWYKYWFNNDKSKARSVETNDSGYALIDLEAIKYESYGRTVHVQSCTVPKDDNSCISDVMSYDAKFISPMTINLNGNGATSSSINTLYSVYHFGTYNSQNEAANNTRKQITSIKIPDRTYKVTYNGNGGTPSKGSEKISYTFNGYYIGGAQLINGSGNFTSYLTNPEYTGNQTATASWTSHAVTLPTADRRGYDNHGWWDNPNGGNKAGDFGGSYTPGSDITLYMHWTPKVYTINYNCNGSWQSNTATYDSNYSVGVSCSRRGYDFSGWTTRSDLQDDGYGWTNWSGTWQYIDGQYGIGNQTLTLYARWTPKQYRINYNCNGSWSSNTATYDSWYSVGVGCSRTGYNFVGWTTRSDLQSDGYNWTNWSGTWQYVDGEYGVSSQSLTLYAMWTPKQYTVSYNCNGYWQSNTATYDRWYDYGVNCSRRGYTFNGWWENGTQYSGGTTWKRDGNMTLTAAWTPNTYWISLQDNGGSGGDGTIYETFDNNIHNAWGSTISSVSVPSRSNTVNFYNNGSLYSSSSSACTFNGYYDGYTQVINRWGGIAFGNSYFADNAYIYADWDCSSNSTVSCPSAPSRSGYVFTGWKYSWGGSACDGGGYYNSSNGSSLYAGWREKTCEDDNTCVAQVNSGTKYDSIQKAVNAAGGGDTVNIIKNGHTEYGISINKSITLNYNGYTHYGSINVGSYATVMIEGNSNGSDTNRGKIEASGAYDTITADTGYVTLLNMIVENGGSTAHHVAARINNGSSLTTSGKTKIVSSNSSTPSGGIQVTNSSVEIKSGTSVEANQYAAVIQGENYTSFTAKGSSFHSYSGSDPTILVRYKVQNNNTVQGNGPSSVYFYSSSITGGSYGVWNAKVNYPVFVYLPTNNVTAHAEGKTNVGGVFILKKPGTDSAREWDIYNRTDIAKCYSWANDESAHNDHPEPKAYGDYRYCTVEKKNHSNSVGGYTTHFYNSKTSVLGNSWCWNYNSYGDSVGC